MWQRWVVVDGGCYFEIDRVGATTATPPLGWFNTGTGCATRQVHPCQLTQHCPRTARAQAPHNTRPNTTYGTVAHGEMLLLSAVCCCPCLLSLRCMRMCLLPAVFRVVGGWATAGSWKVRLVTLPCHGLWSSPPTGMCCAARPRRAEPDPKFMRAREHPTRAPPAF